MALREEFETFGNLMFRWRSYVPLVLAALCAVILITTPSGQINQNPLVESIATLIAFAGLTFRMYTVGCVPRGTSGRNVNEQRATALNITGIYSLVRHPLYFGNFVIWIGIVLFTGCWWLVLVSAAFFWFYYEKIMFAEEEFLRRQYGETYLKWAVDTPAFFPLDWALWKKPSIPFSFKNAVRREYSGFFAIISVISLIKLVKDSIAFEQITINRNWLVFFLLSAVVYGALMYLKKKTTFLDVKGM